jgi:hypothetical protein
VGLELADHALEAQILGEEPVRIEVEAEPADRHAPGDAGQRDDDRHHRDAVAQRECHPAGERAAEHIVIGTAHARRLPGGPKG